MKLYIVNDLHTEFADFEPDVGAADVAILAGDIGVGVAALDWVHEKLPDMPVVYVLGNHEYYRGNLDDIAAFKAAAKSNVHVLEKDSVVIGGVRFVGTTMWTDFELFGRAEREPSMTEAAERMPDFRVIDIGQRTFTPRDSVAVHKESVDWLSEQLSIPFAGHTVVVTHHAPSWLSVAERFKDDALSPAFCSRLERLMEGGEPSIWVHGHTHDAFDYKVYETRVICNPRGYPGESGLFGFQPDLTIDL